MMKSTPLVIALLLVGSSFAEADGEPTSVHGWPAPGTDPSVLTVGSCGECHDESSDSPVLSAPSAGILRQDGCTPCHEVPSARGLFPGRSDYQVSAHAVDSRVIWPGPTPPAKDLSRDQGKCTNCHDPHARRNRGGVIPSLLATTDQELCLGCHDGSVSIHDLASDLRKPYSHSARRRSASHSAGEDGDPSRYSYSSRSRHVSCSDCHNAHVARGGSMATPAPEAAEANRGVSRVRVKNGGAGSVPSYRFIPAADTASSTREYEICFKCHSSWTQIPPGQVDIARKMNPANASHHAVEAVGNNPRIPLQAFVESIDATTILRCSDCHSSDDGKERGSHGSVYAGMLKRPYEEIDVTDRQGLCYLCHNYETYAAVSGMDLSASRFNPPGAIAGHALHVGREHLSCRVCHDSHGSDEFPALLVGSRGVQLLQYTPTVDGGSCRSGCHDLRNYRRNYPW